GFYDQPGSYTITWTYTDAAGNETSQTQTVIVEGTGEEVERLNLTSDCSENPQVEREWRVTNPNDFDVPYTYVVVGTNQTEDLIATPGLSYFTTDAVKGPNTTKIIWLDENGVEQQRVKASGGATCPPDEVEPLKLFSDCSEDPELEREWEVYNPNDFDVPYTYKVVGTKQTEDLIATPGLNYFTTYTVKGSNTTKITWLDENGKKQKRVKASSGEACDPTLTFKTSEGSCEFSLDELPHDLDEVVASAPATYANFNRKRGTYVVGVIAGMRTDGRAGAWEIHNDCTIKPLRQGARKNNSELPNRSHSGLKYKHHWRFEVTGISSDGGTIFADAINDEGYVIKRGQCKAAGAPDVQPGTIVPISWALSDRPFYGRIKGARLGYECEVERYNCSNGYIVGCAASVARTENTSAKESTPSLGAEAGLEAETAWQLQVYPNPVQDWVSLEFSGESQAEQTHVLIYNLSGKLMQQQVLNSKKRSHQLDVRELPGGAYLMQVQQGDRRKTLRLLKE
ncbi:MAG: T9SS type A sorting domain-containing protein, partial [Bacteroidota bacterium]